MNTLVFFSFTLVGVLGCMIGLLYNFLEYITKWKFKWMYPVASLLYQIGFIGLIITFIVGLF